MKKLSRTIAFALALFTGTVEATATESDPGFIELGTFFRGQPEERAKFEAFDRLVQAPAVPLGIQRDEPLQIHVIYPGLQVSDYWHRSVQSFSARMDEIGISHEITSLFTKSAFDIRLQMNAIGRVLREKPDFLVFTLDALRHKGMVSRVLASGHTKVILQNITTPLTGLGPPDPLLYVGFDHEFGTRMLTDEFIHRSPKGARYAIFYGTVGYVSRMRGVTFRQAIEDRTEFELVGEYYVGFDRGRAREAARELLKRDPGISFIYAASTDIAHGVADAIGEYGLRGKVMVNGWGGGGSELDAIRKGELDFTVMRMNDDNGVAMAEAIRLTMEGRAESVPRVYSGAFALIDQQTPDATLERLIDRAFRYSR
ncbi:substrate-binding domain-containing protein [Nisaea sp.]|uniref:substrate-binding domain-containing protein n=1 Tax=Nisaea sp. TaxID=2024842 RepID=UPI003B51B368